MPFRSGLHIDTRHFFINALIGLGAFLLILAIGGKVFGEQERVLPFQPYNTNYIISGDGEDQVKAQFSFKYALVYPFEIGLYFGYTQLMIWDLYKPSSPFRELNYNPEVFWTHDFNYGALDRIQVGMYEHKSNGRDGLASRGMDRGYGEVQLSFGSRINAGIILRGWGYYHKAGNNEDIQEYIGYGRGELFVQLLSGGTWTDRERIYVRGGTGSQIIADTPLRGWFEIGLKTRIITAYIQPSLYVQYYQGYGEYMLDYNVKQKAVRIGLMME